MNAWTGLSIALAILTHSMENGASEFIMGFMTVFVGMVGIVMELADRIERKKNRDGTVSRASR